MLRAHTVEDVRRSERAAMALLPDGALMQHAAAGLAAAVLDLLGGGYGRRVLLLVGSGDNGGDALWAGARLAGRGAQVEALLLSDAAHAGGLAALHSAGGRSTRDLDDLDHSPDLVVDGIVGIGGHLGLRPDAVAALARFDHARLVAVDVPSGVDVDTGEVDGPHVVADLTVTFGTHKVAHLVDPAASACGALHLVDLGLELPGPSVEALQPADVGRLLPRPHAHDHKYTRGVVGVRAGSDTFPGAALLAVGGANCGLAGMVRFVGPEHLADLVRATYPEVVGEGRVQAWVVGPGGGADAQAMLEQAMSDQAQVDDVTVIVDADALAHVDGTMPGCVLTPHAGELAAMLDTERELIEARPLHWARQAATTYDCVVVLKGHHTLVAEPSGKVRVTTTGVPWLATAGAGDVLSGLIGALLAAGLDPFDAASVGSWVHGAAATLAADDGPLVASRVATAIPHLVRRTLEGLGHLDV